MKSYNLKPVLAGKMKHSTDLSRLKSIVDSWLITKEDILKIVIKQLIGPL